MNTATTAYKRFTVYSASLLAGLLPLVAGVVVSAFTIDYHLRTKTQEVAHRSLAYLDSVIDNLAHSAKMNSGWLTAGCEAGKPVSREPAPVLGRLRLVERNCAAPQPKRAPRPSVWLSLRSGSTNATASVLTLHYGSPEHHVAIDVETQLVAGWMALISRDVGLQLEVGDRLLWDDGAMLKGKSSDHDRFDSIVASTRWPYSVGATLSGADALDVIANQLVRLLGPLSVLSVICAGLCHWALSRRQ